MVVDNKKKKKAGLRITSKLYWNVQTPKHPITVIKSYYFRSPSKLAWYPLTWEWEVYLIHHYCSWKRFLMSSFRLNRGLSNLKQNICHILATKCKKFKISKVSWNNYTIFLIIWILSSKQAFSLSLHTYPITKFLLYFA